MADIDANKVDDMLDALNRAIEIHTDRAIQGLSYNKSELAEVVDITERNLGKYIVWNGSARYYAYSENTTYPIGTKVYVNIPNNDFSAQKQIIGQYIADGEVGIFYKNPLEAYEPLTPNLIEDTTIGQKSEAYEDGQAELLANWDLETYPEYTEDVWPLEQMVEIFRADNMDLDTDKKYEGFKYMGISADFKTMLNTFSPIAGDYGIAVILWGIERLDVNENAELTQKVYTLSVRDMIGNVYNYSSYFKQASLYDISEDFSRIARVIVGFYQRGNFKDNSNHYIPVYYTLNEQEHLLKPNIFVKNVSIQFGNDLTNKNDSLRIYTINGETYDPAQKDSLNYKNIDLQWTHLNPSSNEYEILKSSGDAQKNGILDFTIHWYEDAIHTNTDFIKTTDNTVDTAGNKTKLDAYNKWMAVEESNTATAEEKQIARLQLIGSYGLSTPTDYTVQNGVYALTTAGATKVANAKSNMEREDYVSSSIASDVLAGAGWKPLTPTGGGFKYTNFLPDYNRSYSKILCIIEYGPRLESGAYDTASQDYYVVKSNELQLNNLRMTSNSLSDDKANALKINCDDGTNGDYPIYNGTTGELLNREEVSRKRLFQATCYSLSNGDNYMNGNETLIWKIPRTSSMILINNSFIEENALINENQLAEITDKITYDNTYYYIKREAKNSIAPVNNEQEYRIAQYYNKANTNNTVFCYLIKNNEVFETSKTLTFSQHGTSGTDYTFSLGLIQKVDEDWNVVGPGDTALTIGDSNYLEIGFDLFNSKNEKIELTLNQKNAIINAWTGFSKDGYYSGLSFRDPEHETSPTGNATNLDFLVDTENGRVAVKIKSSVSNINNCRYIVLQAAVKNENVDGLKSVKFVQLLPIHVRAADTTWVLRGSDYIIYDDKGANPSCYNDYYQLIRIDENGNDQIFKTGFTIESSGFDNDVQTRTYYPSIVPLSKENNVSVDYKLEPTPLYVDGISKEIAVCCNGGQAGVIYTCPLVILQNKYQIAAINNWNGELVVDQQGNKILASMVGAGHKNDDNTFSGVLMGDIVQKNAYTGNDEQQTGLFGYDSGAQTFGFNADGTAFLGKSDIGRIYVDGNTGRITSAAREDYEISKDKDPRGTDINLRDNYIDIQGVGTSTSSDTNKSRIHIDANLVPTQREIQELGQTEANARHTGAYFSVHSNTGNELIYIANNSYFLQTNNYDESREKGLKIDLKEGSFNSYDTITIKGAIGSSINFGDNSNYLRLGNSDGGAYFNMYKAAGDPDKAFKTLRTAYNTLKTESGFTDSQLTNDIPSVSNNLPTNGHDKKYYKLKVDGNGKTVVDTKLTTLSNSITTYSNNLADAQSALLIADNNLNTAQTNYNIKNNNFISQKANYDNDYRNFNAGLNNVVNDEIAALLIVLNGNPNTGDIGLRARAEAAKTLYNTKNEDYFTALFAYNEELALGETLLAEKDRYNTALIQKRADLTALERDIETAEALLSAAEQDDNQIEITRLSNLLSNLLEQKETLLAEESALQESYDNAVTAYSAWLNNNTLQNLKDDLDDAEDDKNNAYDDWEEKLETLNNKEQELVQKEALRDNLDSELQRLADNLMELGPKVLGPNLPQDEEIRLLLSNYNPSVALNQRATWVTPSQNGVILAERNAALLNLNTAQIEATTAQQNLNTAQTNLNTAQGNYDELTDAYVDYKDAYQDYVDNIDNNGDGSITITNQGTSSDKRILIGKKFYVTGEGKIFSSGGTIGGWTITGSQLYSDGSDGKRVALQSISDDMAWVIAAGGTDKKSYGAYPFRVHKDGSLYSTKGKIATWNINNGYLMAGTAGKNNIVGISTSEGSGSKDYAFIAGANANTNAGWAAAPFRVTHNGALYATNATISGSISASSISGSTITGGTITGGTISGGTITGASISGGTVTAESLTLGGKKVNWTSTNIVTGISDLVANLSGGKWICSKTIDCIVSVDFDNQTTVSGHFDTAKILSWPDPSYSNTQAIPTKVKVKLTLSRVSATVLGAVTATDSSKEDSSTL